MYHQFIPAKIELVQLHNKNQYLLIELFIDWNVCDCTEGWQFYVCKEVGF